MPVELNPVGKIYMQGFGEIECQVMEIAFPVSIIADVLLSADFSASVNGVVRVDPIPQGAMVAKSFGHRGEPLVVPGKIVLPQLGELRAVRGMTLR